MNDKFISNYTIKRNGTIISKKTKHKIKPYVLKNGYLQVTLYDFTGHHKKFLVHRLVAMAYIPNPNHLPQVNHKNMNRLDCRVDNLEWCTALDNIHHARANGRNIYTFERNKKISHTKKGIPRSQEVKKKVSETMLRNGTTKGKNNGMYGRHLTLQQIQKRTHSRFHKNKPVDGCPYCVA